ncbi:hypothetical protein GCM10023183_05560 [Nibribacter koreensis]|uniref:Uncharacterized protein n=1 Tax=Nibribacter koreensis TaxID=1084519 RepID=A0ABP8F988_9BACT
MATKDKAASGNIAQPPAMVKSNKDTDSWVATAAALAVVSATAVVAGVVI